MTPTSEFPRLLDTAMAEVQRGTREIVDRHALATYPQWGYDESRAFLTFANGAEQFVVLAQLVGTRGTEGDRWRWAWDDPALPERVTRSARVARDWGRAQEIALLTEPEIAADETLAWKLAAFAARLTGCPAVYRGQSGDRFLYFAFAVPPK